MSKMESVRSSARGTGRLAALLLVLVVAAPAAANSSNEAMADEGGTGAVAALATLVYGPVKVAYALGGLVFGGAAWAFSGGDNDTLQAVITPAVRGDYVITPDVIRGERGLEFFGRDPRYREPPAVGSGPPALVYEEY